MLQERPGARGHGRRRARRRVRAGPAGRRGGAVVGVDADWQRVMFMNITRDEHHEHQPLRDLPRDLDRVLIN